MLENLQFISFIALLTIGIFFFLVGTLGLLRFPDIYCRLHATTKCDTLGAGAILLALALYEPSFINIIKLMLIAIFVLISSSTSGHAISRSCLKRGIKPWTKGAE